MNTAVKGSIQDVAAGNGKRGAELEKYILRLYVTGPSSISARAVVNARRIFESHLKGRYQLEIINVADNVARAIDDQVVAAPTLLKLSPPPLKRFIGDMSDTERVVKGLNVRSPTEY